LLLGDLLDVDAARPIESSIELTPEYGPVFELSVPIGSRILVSSFERVDELCDESRFDKKVAGGSSCLIFVPAVGLPQRHARATAVLGNVLYAGLVIRDAISLGGVLQASGRLRLIA
jgi:hypothetical protein